MSWKEIDNKVFYEHPPKDGTVIMLGWIGSDYVEYHARWGLHQQSGVMRWVDSYGFAIANPTHWDHLPAAPKKHIGNDHQSLPRSVAYDRYTFEPIQNNDDEADGA